MSFGMSKGLDFDSFCRIVKTLSVKRIDDRGVVAEAAIPPEYFSQAFQVPIFAFGFEPQSSSSGRARV